MRTTNAIVRRWAGLVAHRWHDRARRSGDRRVRTIGAFVSIAVVAPMALVGNPALASPAPASASADALAQRAVAADSALVASAGPPSAYGAVITIVGHGNGHGDGLSQWGAYGYSTAYNWDWHQILAHYYGGTTEATADSNAAMSVRLRALDDATFTAVVDQAANLVTNADGQNAKYRTVLALETGDGVYKVYGRADQAVCPQTAVASALDAAGSGWTVIAGSFTSKSTAGAVLAVSAAGIDPATATRSDLPGVCQPDGAVKLYRGLIQIVNGNTGENRTVNVVPLDQYVRGVVPRESPASWADAGGGKGANALRAQAVAARTYASTQTRYAYAKTCDTDACQVYGGAARRAAPADALDVLEDARTDQAVAATAGVVLHNADGTLSFTQFGSSSGGFTSGANFPAVEDIGDAVPQNPHNRWATTVLRTDIETAYPAIGALLAVDVTKRNGLGEWGGRVQSMILRGAKGNVTLTGDQFRLALGLRSTWFDVPSGCDGPASLGPLPTATASTFHGLSPVRLVDTRSGQGASAAPVSSGCILPVKVSSLFDLPAAASAVSLSITVVNPVAAGYLVAYPCDGGRPVASNVNYRPGETVANQANVALDNEGQVCVYVHQRADIVVDLLGWFGGTDGSRLVPVAPARLTDTRDGTGGTTGPLPADGLVVVNVAGHGSVPADAKPSAVVLNLTSTGAAGDGFFTAYPCDRDRPTTSNLNTIADRDVAAHAVVAVSSTGTVCVFTHVAGHVIVDVSGWYGSPVGASSGRYTPLPPNRLFDTRDTSKVGSGIVASGDVLRVPVAGLAGVPAGGVAKAVAVNVTATGAAGAGHLTVYPCDQSLPASSSVNYLAAADVANLVTVPLGADGQLCVFANRSTHVVVDAAGWYSA